MLYECVMVDELHIARKQYLDGSIPTGFQRTTIVGVDGQVPLKDRRIRIIQLGLEEDACREVSDIGHRRTYLTDRLGMPLIETVTGPDMRTPQEVAEVAQILRRIVRSTGRVRTGIGAAREDVNVSVSGGTRIEIKGVPRIPRIPLLTYNEAMRQWNLLRLREELARRGITAETFKSGAEDITKIVRRTNYLPIQSAMSAGMCAYGVRLQGFRGLLNWPTQTSTYFHQEISDRVRVVACLTVLPNIVHADSLGEGLAGSEWPNIKRALGAADGDTVVVVWGPEADAKLAAQEIVVRAKEATIGIPSETRQALKDGTNGFERILPGPDRMYPDTDLPPKQIAPDRMAWIQAGLPPNILTREAWYREIGVPRDLIEQLSISSLAPLFDEAVRRRGIDPKLAALILVHYPRILKKKSVAFEAEAAVLLADVFQALQDERLYREGVLDLLERALTTGRPVAELLSEPIADEFLAREEARIAGLLTGRRFIDAPRRQRRAMGLLMGEWRGRTPGAAAAKSMSEALEKVQP